MALGNFLAELKRRHVYRAGCAYALAAFAMIEIVSNVAPMFDLPGWVGRALVLALIVGFPVTLLAAWMIEGKQVGGAPAPSASKLDVVLAGGLILVGGLLVYQQMAPAHDTRPPQAAAGEGVSLAVLPFVNLSGDPSQEFFSDGMTEEITSALAKVKGLKVVGRTSAFEFKGQNKDLHAIGQALRASHLLEGSLRKSGNRVRITGQLIRADDGTHVWTENYDRELTDMFATQDDIARSIATALQAPLGLKAGETLVTRRDIAPENYQTYLRARALYRSRGTSPRYEDIIDLLEGLVAAEPGYAPAWGLLAAAYQKLPRFGANDGRTLTLEELKPITDTAYAKARTAAQRAIDLDPGNAQAYAALSGAQQQGQLQKSEDLLRQALELEPSNPDVMFEYGILLTQLGRLRDAVALSQKLISIEPLVPVFNATAALSFWAAGQFDTALALAKGLPMTYGARALNVSVIQAAMGRYAEAAETILGTPAERLKPEDAAAVALLLRKAPAKVPPQELPMLTAEYHWVYLYVGAPERLPLGFSFPGGLIISWANPSWAPLRKIPAFKVWARERGLVDYWRARGWPDLCHPVGADDFECS